MMRVHLVALAFLALCAGYTSAAGFDGAYANLSLFIEENREAILALGTSPEPAVISVAAPCELIQVSATPPTSVHALRPSDVNVVASLGDSITAAFGAEATNILNLLVEYRGVSWSGGGQNTYEVTQTMPNILKHFNSKLYGYATGNGGAASDNAVFNIAVTGAVAEDLPLQARNLVAAMTDNPAINLNDDWKVITIWIGGNDLCAVCDDQERYSAEKYQGHIQTTLEIIQAHIPRAFVNLVSILDINRLHQIRGGLCDSFHKTVCPCVQRSIETRAIVERMAQSYQQAARNIAQMAQFQTDTFAVVLQPFFIDTQIPLLPDGQPDRSYFAPDCFHFSYKAHAAAATALWNNMLQPVGSKDTAWTLNAPPICPTQSKPYICTATNQCGASSGVFAHHNAGGLAPPATLNLEQRTMMVLALVLIVAVPVALLAYMRWRKQRRAGYTPIPGTSSVNASPSETTTV